VLKRAAVVYLRVSTAEQVENYSLDTQKRACIEYCEREGFEVDRIFREEGESAKTANRPQLQAMLNYCAKEAKRRSIVAAVVYRVDRLSRDALDYLVIRAALLRLGVQVHSATESFDDSPGGKLHEGLMAILAQFDNDVRAARTKAGMLEGLARGRWMWQAPLGYVKGDRDSPSLLRDPHLAPLVQFAFERVASGRMSRPEVLAEVTSLGLVTRRGKAMSPQSFGEMLSSPLYMGRIISPKLEFDGPGDFEALVSPELFESVQAVLEGRARNKESRHLDNPDFPLRRVVRCGRCGSPLTASWSRGRSGRYPYYRCYRKGCRGTSIRKERLEGLFVSHLEALSVRSEVFALLDAVVTDAWNDRLRESLAAEKRLVTCMRDLEAKVDRFVDALVAGKISQSIYDRQVVRLEKEQAQLKIQIEAAKPPEIDLAVTLVFAQNLLEDLPGCWNRLNWQQKRPFVWALYPQGLTYADGGIGTAQTPWLLTQIGAGSSSGNGLAPPTGFEPVFPP
jgi:DNA invertase Pin-like site-specific DNA recombinase